MELAPRLLRVKDAAVYCGFAKSTLDKMRCKGDGPRFIRRGKAVYYLVADLDDWIAALPRFSNTSQPVTTSEEEPES